MWGSFKGHYFWPANLELHLQIPNKHELILYQSVKVHLFLKGHKNLELSSNYFDICIVNQLIRRNNWNITANFCGLLRKAELQRVIQYKWDITKSSLAFPTCILFVSDNLHTGNFFILQIKFTGFFWWGHRITLKRYNLNTLLVFIQGGTHIYFRKRKKEIVITFQTSSISSRTLGSKHGLRTHDDKNSNSLQPKSISQSQIENSVKYIKILAFCVKNGWVK